VNADKAEQTVASGAWKGGLMDEIMEGVKTRTLGLVGVSPGGVIREVRRGKNDWMVRIGCKRWVLKRSANEDGGMVAMGDVW
jgi:hypothetical protein